MPSPTKGDGPEESSAEGSARTDGAEGRLYVHFLFLTPHPLALPHSAKGAPFDFHQWPGDDMVWALNEDPAAPEPDDPDRPSVSIQLVHNVLAQRAPLDAVDTLMEAMPLIWPWSERGSRAGLAHNSLPDQEADVSVVSVQVCNLGGLARWEADEEQYVEECLDQAVAACQDLQRAAGLASHEADALISAPLLPVLIPCSVVRDDQNGFQPLSTFAIPNTQSLQFRHFEPAKDVSMESIQAALAATEAGNPFIPVDDLSREAIWSVRTGSYWSALVQAAAAVELLVHTLARFMAWEGGMTPIEAAADLQRSTSSMLTFASEHVGKRLGGTWEGTVPGPVRDWSVDLIQKRNLVLHAGLPVSEGEAKRGVDAAFGLVEFAKSRVVTQRALPKFPLAAAALIGEPGLSSRGRFTRKVRAALDEEPNFLHRFRLWREYLEAGAAPVSPRAEECLLIGVYDISTDSLSWVVQHNSRLWAAKAQLTGPLPAKVQHSMDGLPERLRNGGFSGVADVPLPGVRSWRRSSDWMHSYGLLPSRACMRTKR